MSSYKPTVPISPIYAEKQFNLLTKQEQRYAYHFTRASVEGQKICLFEVSHESPAIFLLLHLVFSGQKISHLKQSFIKNGGTQEIWSQLIAYSGAFLGQLGNYKSFGGTKFVPQASSEQFRKLIESCSNFCKHKDLINELWNHTNKLIYDLSAQYLKIDLYPKGVTGYYSNKLTKEEIDLADQLLGILGISELNTHIYKSGQAIIIKVCSINQSSKTHIFKQRKFFVQYGFMGPFLNRIVTQLKKAKQYAANDIQKKMIQAYIDHFITGDIQTHKQSQRHWVKDIGPIVQTNLGFIETYLDPKQVRAYYQGMVAVVDKKASEVVGKLVANAENLLNKYIPWPKEFEKDVFLKPDFTSLSVLTFASFDTPRGINIPNYDDIRGQIGFKNVFLANNIVAPKKRPPYLNEQDGQLLIDLFRQVAFHSVSYHELLGHGCGKLFTEKNGAFNFDKNTINPLTQKPVESWFKDNQTWSNKFKSLTNPYQECRADSVALYYSCFQQAVLLIQPEFGKEGWKKLRDATWINFANMGVNVLQFYNAQDKKWLQAHSNGRFVIMRVLLEAGQNFLKVQKTKNNQGKDWIQITLDREKIETVGLPALKKFLLKLNVYKATADLENAQKMYGEYSQVDQFFLSIRDIVNANKTQRPIEIKGNIKQIEEKLSYEHYDITFQGIIQSSLARHPHFDLELLYEWRNLLPLLS